MKKEEEEGSTSATEAARPSPNGLRDFPEVQLEMDGKKRGGVEEEEKKLEKAVFQTFFLCVKKSSISASQCIKVKKSLF